MGSCNSSNKVLALQKVQNQQLQRQNLEKLKKQQSLSEGEILSETLEQSIKDHKEEEQTKESILENISMDQLEKQGYRLVNHPRIKQIVEDFQVRGDEDLINNRGNKLYKKSKFQI